MKFRILSIKAIGAFLSLMGIAAYSTAQTPPTANKPITETQVPAPYQAARTVESAYPAGTKANFVRIREAMGAVTDANFDGAGYTDVKEATQYVDGLGRPLQSVVRQATPGASPKDMVTAMLYDAMGRQVYSYLPYVSTSSDGQFRMDPFAEQAGFMQGHYPGEQLYYGKTVYENSPLNRVLKTFAPGNSWVGSEGNTSEHAIQYQYLFNSSSDDVQIWNFELVMMDEFTIYMPVSHGAYDAGELFKTVMVDEAGNASIEYKDKADRIILRKVQAASSIPADFSGYDGFLCTYYVYDDLGQLRTVIQPKGVDAIRSTWVCSMETFNSLCFRYDYDKRGRIVAKKVPGAEWTYMIYDQRDRLVFTQDGNMRSNHQWLANLYDGLNRQVLLAMITYTGNLQTYVDQNSGAGTSSEITTNQASPTNLFVSERTAGEGQYKAEETISFTQEFASESGAEFETILQAEPASENVVVLDNPIPPGSNPIALVYTYYDDYSWTNRSYTAINNPKLATEVGGEPHAVTLPGQAFEQIRGMVAGKKVRVIEDAGDLTKGNFLESVVFYDDHGRPIQSQAENYKSGWDILTSQYDFTGKVLGTYLDHHNPAVSVNGSTSVLTKNVYDEGGRLLEIWKTINDDASKKALLSKNSYNDLGQLMTKELGRKRDESTGTYTTEPLETLDYEYNIRGWLKGINKAYANSSSSASHWFGMELDYDWGFGHNQFNGNIAGAKWKSTGDDQLRAFGYSYDNSNRILGADFSQYGSTAYEDNSTINFDVVFGDGQNPASAYDANGNILKVKRWGLKPLSGSSLIDDLEYSYVNGDYNGNQLFNVYDHVNDPDTKLGDFHWKNYGGFGGKQDYANGILEIDYSYDDNGNLTRDLNKNIWTSNGGAQEDGIIYNYLNLPSRIGMYQKGEIVYIYDAEGNKLEKRVEDRTANPNANMVVTSYIGGFVYESTLTQPNSPLLNEGNAELKFMLDEEGRVRFGEHLNNGLKDLAFDYFVKDHLGNVRMVLTDEIQTDAYPNASMEESNSAIEGQFYGNLDNTRSPLPSGYPLDSYTDPDANGRVAKLRGDGQKIGPSMALKVMAGDKFNLRVSSWYKLAGATPQTPINPLPDLLTALADGIAGAGNKFTAAEISNSGALTPGATNFLNSRTYSNDKPKAYINWVLFDEQFNLVPESSGFEQVGDENLNAVEAHVKNNLTVSKNGYLYIYVSNETPNIDVFFDNLQLIHIRGPLLEETHYYPFGLPMAGISSKAAGTLQNKYLFNGKEIQTKEFADGSGLEMYDFKYRFYDMQLGRFFNQDRLADKFSYMSPYQFCSNNPIWLREIDGLEGVKYTETDSSGKKKIIVEKNVVVLTERIKAIPTGATQKQIKKINKQNERIQARNAAKVANVITELNTFYNGSDGKGTTDSKGNAVLFKFNVTGVSDINKKGMSAKQIDAAYSKISQGNGMAAVSQFDHSISLTAPASVLTNDFASGGVFGNTSAGRIMRINYGAPDGTVSHEVSHTLGLIDNGYTRGGILNSPPEQILPSEVDEILKQAYDKM